MSGTSKDEGAKNQYKVWESEPKPNEAQQAKLITAVLNKDAVAFGEDPNINPENRELFLHRYASYGEFREQAWEMLEEVTPTYMKHGTDKISAVIDDYRLGEYAWTAITYVASFTSFKDMPPPQRLEASRASANRSDPDLVARVCRVAPTAEKFAEYGKKLLQAAEPSFNRKEEVEDFRLAYRVVSRIIYGKQQEYLEQLQFLDQEAERY